jgi:hypothetical protein
MACVASQLDLGKAGKPAGNFRVQAKTINTMKLIKAFLLTASLLCSVGTVKAAVTFSVTPSAVSNTYNGTITLQVTNVPTGDTVVVQKFLDANTNGLIDGTDPLVQQFNLTDGQGGMVIGGVTNFNVPGDLNATTGAITAALNFQNGDFVQNLVGNYLYVLSSPVGHFTPLTNSFSVTNFPFLQKFTGNVVSNGTSTTLSNAIVLLFPPPRPGHNGLGQPFGGTVANNSGAYTIQAPVGTYTLLAFSGNYVANTKKAPVLTLTGSATITTNLSLTNATTSVSGRIVDANNTNVGLPGIFMPAESTNGLLATTFSDTNGYFTVRVTAGQWGLGSDDSGLIVHGYVGWNNSIATNSGATNVTLAYPMANALLYGSVNDNLGNPLVGIDVSANDSSSNLFQADGYTGSNGNYFVGVLGGLGGNDLWQEGIGGDSAPTHYIFSLPQVDQNGGTNLAVGQAVLQNFTAILATNYITGNVKESNGTNIVGVGVSANATINGTNYQNNVDTDTNGNYSLNVPNGDWSVGLNCNGGSDSLDSILGVGNYQCPNSQNVTNNNNNATNNFTVQPCGGIQILTTNLPIGELNINYDQFLQGSSCHGGLSWSLASGSTDGLNISSNGELSGMPGSSGVFVFTVQASDGVNITNQQLSLIISNAVAVVTTSLPNGTNGAAYSQQLQAGGGVPFGGPSSYSWSLASGSLPVNLNLATNGLLSGTAATNGTFNFHVNVTDSLGGSYNQALSLTINSQSVPLQITTTFLPGSTQNATYNTTLTATGGQPPYSWSLAPGSAGLPYYLSLSGNGAISGTPVNAGTSSFIARVTDATLATADQVLSLTVASSTNNPVIVLNSVQYKNGQFQFTFNTAPGTSYTLQVSTNLLTWASVSTFNGSGGPLTVSDLTAGSSPRFYRLKIGP